MPIKTTEFKSTFPKMILKTAICVLKMHLKMFLKIAVLSNSTYLCVITFPNFPEQCPAECLLLNSCIYEYDTFTSAHFEVLPIVQNSFYGIRTKNISQNRFA